MKNTTSYQKRKIVNHLQANGYQNFNDIRYHLRVAGKESDGWQRHIYIDILPQFKGQYYIIAKLEFFEQQPDCDIRNMITVQRNINCVKELQLLEDNIDELLPIRSCLFKTFSDRK